MEEKFKQAVNQVVKDFKKDQKTKIDEDSFVRFNQDLASLQAFIDESQLIAAELYKALNLKIYHSENITREQKGVLQEKIDKAYKDVTEPSKLDTLLSTANSAKDAVAGAAGSLKNKFVRVLPKALKNPPTAESLRAIEMPNQHFAFDASGSSGQQDSDTSVAVTPPKRRGRKKRASTPVSLGEDQVSSSETLPPLPISEELPNVESFAAEEAERLAQEERMLEDTQAKEAAKKAIQEAQRKAQELAESKRQEEAEAKRLAEETARKAAEEERARQEAELKRQEEEAARAREEAELKRKEEEAAKVREEAERRVQEAAELKRKEAEAATVREQQAREKECLKKAQEAQLLRDQEALNEKNAKLKAQIDAQDVAITLRREEIGRVEARINTVIENFNNHFLLADLRARREDLVLVPFLFSGKLARIKSGGEGYVQNPNNKEVVLNALVNTGIYYFELARRFFSESYQKRRSGYSTYLDRCLQASEIVRDLKTSKQKVDEISQSINAYFSARTNDYFEGRMLPGEEPIDASRPIVGLKEQLQTEFDTKARNLNEIQRLNEEKQNLEGQQLKNNREFERIADELKKVQSYGSYAQLAQGFAK